MVRLLLEAGADKDVKVSCGHTALTCASGEGHSETVRLLIEAGSDLDADPSQSNGTSLRM